MKTGRWGLATAPATAADSLERERDAADAVLSEIQMLIGRLRVLNANVPGVVGVVGVSGVGGGRPSERVRRAAARVRMKVDAQAGTATPEWIRRIAQGR